jgi:putative hemolysin
MDLLYHAYLYYQGLGFFITLALCALFSFIETSITALRIFKLKELAKNETAYKALFEILEKQPNKILFTILIANSLCNASCTAFITSFMQSVFLELNLSENLGLTLGVGIATCAIVIFGEIIPKNIARVQGDRLLKYTLGITNLTYYILHPLVTLITKFTNSLIFKFIKTNKLESEPSEQEISFLIDYINKKGLIDTEKTDMLLSIFKLSEKSIKEIIIPEPEMICINAQSTIKNTLEMFTKHQFSRMPVYENTPDNIVGIIYIKDFIYKNISDNSEIKSYIRPILFVPETMKVSQLLKEFKRSRKHMSIVLNEFGGIEGLATLEDVLEEIVGPIIDEHEKAYKNITYINNNKLLVNGSTNLQELNKILNIKFETNAISIGGFIIEMLQRLPSEGESLNYKNYKFKIESATHKKIIKIMIIKENQKGDTDEQKDILMYNLNNHNAYSNTIKKL